MNTNATDAAARHLADAQRRLACEARDWIRRGAIPGSPKLKEILALVRKSRGEEETLRLATEIDAWYPTREKWLPALIERHKPYPDAPPPSTPADRGRPQATGPDTPSPRTGGFLARMRYTPG